MKRLISCELNIDSGNVELRYSDGSMLAIDCTAVESNVETALNRCSKLDWLVYTVPLEYVELVLDRHLKRVPSPYNGIGLDS